MAELIVQCDGEEAVLLMEILLGSRMFLALTDARLCRYLSSATTFNLTPVLHLVFLAI